MAQRTSREKGSKTGKLESGDPELQWVSADKAIEERIRSIVENDDLNDDTALLFLQSWWSDKYNRPLKDPLLQDYTFEELLYEYYNHNVRTEARKAALDKQDDIIEDKKAQEALDWAEQEEKKELEELARQEAKAKAAPAESDEEWMQRQLEAEIAAGKEAYGEDYGEDLNFSSDE